MVRFRSLFSFKVNVKIVLRISWAVTNLWTLYTVHPLTDLNQTWYTVNIWQSLKPIYYTPHNEVVEGIIFLTGVKTYLLFINSLCNGVVWLCNKMYLVYFRDKFKQLNVLLSSKCINFLQLIKKIYCRYFLFKPNVFQRYLFFAHKYFYQTIRYVNIFLRVHSCIHKNLGWIHVVQCMTQTFSVWFV